MLIFSTTLLLLSLTLIVSNVFGNTFTNPIVESAPDPWMQYYKGYYYMSATPGGNTIRIRKSKTLDGLRTATNQVVFNHTLHNTWAPEFHLINDKWYLYYTAGATGNLNSQRIHVAESQGDDPMGPYHFKADLHDPKENGWAIDPSIITINKHLYLLGSFQTPGLQDLFIMPLANPWTPSGSKILLSSPLLSWERSGTTIAVNEGPEALQHNNKTFIVYSASFCGTADYKLGLLELTGTDPMNPKHWHKHPQPYFVRNDSVHVYGPGHNGFFRSPDGHEDWIVYHANDKQEYGCDHHRSSRAKRFGWNSNGTPNFGTPDQAGVRLTSPSGE
ncbi:extracellular exo-alpha-(1-_5)-L-arabinofuranosidase-like [Oppia nitens]|uniref:extracellular exo-alpha-(1->5)-L-arabinofuranosidase-like n=1 Tax=Oppia nitens TaxID=1686743 RepID=UPI0023DAD9CF|nr:extracellular exo-alpha-(1->5)-L-arabinofuranosidase-like [Oppia nitens]